MGRNLIFVLLGFAIVVLALDAAGVVPLGILGDDAGGGGSGTGDLLGAEGEDGKGPTLETLGSEGAKKGVADDGDPSAPSATPSEVRGATRGGGVVRGRVVQGKGGIPLRGISVQLTRFDSLLSYLRAPVNGRYDVLVAATDAKGRFAFLDVTPAKDYVVRASEVGFAVASSDELDLSGRETIDVGDLAMGPGATVTGRVLGHEGKPARDVRVAATWMIQNPLGIVLTDPDTAPWLQMETTTGEDGRYTLEYLEPTDTTLFFVAPSGASEIVRKVAFDESTQLELPDVKLPGPLSLAGTVTWGDGTPIAGARVFAANTMGGAVRPTESKADGSWRIGWLPDGKTTNLGVLIPGMPVHMEMGVAVGREDVAIAFPVPGTLRGTVLRAQSGEPIPYFRIQLDPKEPPKDWTARFVAKQVRQGLGAQPFVSDEGAFEFPQVAPGTYTLEVTAAGYPVTRHEDVVVTAKQTTELRVEVGEGYVASGTVRRFTGEPVSAARLYVIHGGVKAGAAGPQLHGYIRDREPDAVTRGDGSFQLPPLTPGRYDVIASRPEVLPGVLRGIDLSGGDAPNVTIELPPSGRVRGRILDEHARPAKGETVYVLYRNGIVRTVEAGDDGRFELDGMPVGPCVVRWLSLQTVGAHYRTFRNGTPEEKEKAYDQLRLDGEEHEIVDGQVAEVTLRLPRRTAVTGRLLATPEVLKAEDGFYVTVTGGGRWVRVDMDDDGRFETKLLPGKYVAYVPTAKNNWSAVEFEVPDAPTHQVDLSP